MEKMERDFAVKQKLDTASIPGRSSTSNKNDKFKKETERSMVTSKAAAECIQHTNLWESFIVKNEMLDIKESPKHNHFEESYSIDTGSCQKETGFEQHVDCLSTDEDESELELELDGIAEGMEEFFSLSTWDSEYFPEATESNRGSSTNPLFSINNGFRESLEKRRNETIFRPIEKLITHASPSPVKIGKTTHVDSTIKHLIQPLTLENTSPYSKKVAKKGRVMICPLCCDEVHSHFARHLFRSHKDRQDIMELQKLEPRSKERLEYIRTLRKRGYFIMKTQRNISVPIRSTKDPDTEYFVCTFCLGYYAKTNLSKHVKSCQSKLKNVESAEKKCLQKSQNLMASLDVENAEKKCLQKSQTSTSSLFAENEDFLKKSRLKEEVFGVMRPDDISYAAKSDPLTCLYGDACLNKYNRKHIATVISNKMREMGRLLIALREVNNEIVSLFDALKPQNFNSLLDATKIISGFHNTEKPFGASSLALQMGTTLKFLCNISLKLVTENRRIPNLRWADREKKISEIKNLKKLIESHWCTEISKSALNTLRDRHWKKPAQLHLNNDIQLFNEFVKNEAERAFSRLENNKDIKSNYEILIECVLAETLMFNRISGELLFLTVERYKSNMDCFVFNHLTNVEKLMCENFKRVVVGGRVFPKVPIFFSKKIQRYIDMLLRVRNANGIVPKSNPYLFAKADSQRYWMSGAIILKQFAQRCGAKEPCNLTSTRFRKHIATTLQLLSVGDKEMEQIAIILGHTKENFTEFYRLSEDIHQTAKVAKILLLLEKGKGEEFKGRSLNEIELEDNVYVTTESECSYNDENSVSENVLSKKISIIEVRDISGFSGTEGCNRSKENCSVLETRTFDDHTKDCSLNKFNEKGKGNEFRGKILNEIELEDDVYVTTESECSDNDEDSVIENVLSKKKSILEVQRNISGTEGCNGDKENCSVLETRAFDDHAKDCSVKEFNEKGKEKEFKAKSLNEIELEDNVYVTPESECCDNGDSVSENVLTKKIPIIEVQRDISGTEGCNGDKENCSVLETFEDYTKECSVNESNVKRRRSNESRSDDEKDSSVSKKKCFEQSLPATKLKVSNRKRWSEKEKKLVTAYFQKHIDTKTAPKKHECVEFLSRNREVFIDKCWVRVKTFVYNTYRVK